MGIELRGKNGAIDLKVPIKQLGGAVDSVNGMTGDVTLTANDVGAIDKYNGMTPVECVFPPLFDGDSESSRIFYVKQGVINPVDYKTVTDDIKTAWRNLTFLTDATVGKLSSYQRNIKGIAPLIEIGVFGEDFFNTVTWDSSCVFFDDPITQSKKITIWATSASSKSFGVNVDGPNGYSASDSYSILNDEFNGNSVVRTTLCTISNNPNDTSSKLYQQEMAAAPTKDMQIATKKYVDDSASNSLNITGATIGQIAKITAVDATGKPTAWQAVNMPSGGGETWELINEITIPDNAGETNALVINEDLSGNPFELKKALLLVYMPKYTGGSTIPKFAFSSLNGISSGGSAPASYTNFVSPDSAQNRSMWWRVSVANNGLPYHEELAKTNVSGNKRAIGGNGVMGLFDEYIIDGTEPAKESITEIGTKGNLIYAGCYFALYGVRK